MARQSGLMTIEREAEAAAAQRAPRAASSSPGLCVNCDRAADCALPRAEGMPVLFCEEWTAGAAQSGSVLDTSEERATERDDDRGSATGARPRGLCATCEAFPTCAFSKPPEGIWHCEEYV